MQQTNDVIISIVLSGTTKILISTLPFTWKIVMNHFRGCLLIGLLVVFSDQLSAELVTFNEFAQGTVVDDEYKFKGLVFASSSTNLVEIVDITQDATGGTPVGSGSGPNGLRIINSPAWDDTIIISFVDPVNQTSPAFVKAASFSYFSDAEGASFGRILAFDAGHNLIDSSISVLGGTGFDGIQAYETLSVSGEIWSVEIDGFEDVIVDEFVYAVPEPSTILTLFVALLCLGRRYKSQN